MHVPVLTLCWTQTERRQINVIALLGLNLKKATLLDAGLVMLTYSAIGLCFLW